MTSNIYVAGHKGMVGSAIVRHLKLNGSNNIITKSKAELNLTNQADVANFFSTNKVDEVYLAAAKVGGIHANNEYPAEFIYENLIIQANIIHQAYKSGVKKLLFLGSSCIYPKFADQPMTENALLTGMLEPTNEPYAVAKIAGIKLCESYNRQYGVDYRSVMPTNLYGPNDNFHLENSHVVPALIRRFHDAKINSLTEVVIWGTGTPKREFLYVDDMASASVFVMGLSVDEYISNTEPMLSHVNVGTGVDCSIKVLAETIANVVGFSGEIIFDTQKPDGSPRKLMNVDRLKEMGWTYGTELNVGLSRAYKWYLENVENVRS